MVTCRALWLHCFQGYLLSWDVFWDLTSNLIISGCDSTLTVLGMSAVISSVAHYLGLSILAFIGMTECVCAVQTFIISHTYWHKNAPGVSWFVSFWPFRFDGGGGQAFRLRGSCSVLHPGSADRPQQPGPRGAPGMSLQDSCLQLPSRLTDWLLNRV